MAVIVIGSSLLISEVVRLERCIDGGDDDGAVELWIVFDGCADLRDRFVELECDIGGAVMRAT